MADTVEIPAELSDYDLMELVVFESKVESEGLDYAADEYAPRPEFTGLRRLSATEAKELWNRHGSAVAAWWKAHPENGVDLHNAHLDASRARQHDACLWAVRHENGNVSPVESEETARGLAASPGWRVAGVLRRDVPAGAWGEA